MILQTSITSISAYPYNLQNPLLHLGSFCCASESADSHSTTSPPLSVRNCCINLIQFAELKDLQPTPGQRSEGQVGKCKLEEGHLTLKEVISIISEMSVSSYFSGKGWLLFRGKLYFSLANNDWTNRKSMVGSASSWESFVECCWANINQTNQQTSTKWIDADGDQG